ncbi:MAG: hypothetical protein AAB538_03895 [Patescibacteria group bacterium]
MNTAFFKQYLGKNVVRWLGAAVLEHVRALGVGILILGMAAAIVLGISLFIFPPKGEEQVSAPPARRLSVETIDRLELWIEEVDAERGAGFPLPERPMFVVEDIPVENE